jgi:hypothetical protein
MAKTSHQASRVARPSGQSALTKRYGSIAEIKRDLFPNAAAEEAAAESGRGGREYEKLMDEFFGPRQRSLA